jgi:hypothetical protein
VYITGAILSWVLTLLALSGVWGRKWSRIKITLILVATWSFLIPVYFFVHWQEGLKHGPGAATLLMVIVALVNTQATLFNYTLENFLGLVLNTNGRPLKHAGTYYAVSYFGGTTLRVVAHFVTIVGAARGDDRLFNGGIVAFGIIVVFEVTAIVVRAVQVNRELVRSVQALHSDLRVMNLNPVVVEFAERLDRARWIGPSYSVVAFGVGVSFPILYVRFDTSIPYAFALWAILVLSWPMIGTAPIVMVRSKLGMQMEKGKTKPSADGNAPLNGIVPQTSSVNKSPRLPEDTRHKKTLVEDTAVAAYVTNPANAF